MIQTESKTTASFKKDKIVIKCLHKQKMMIQFHFLFNNNYEMFDPSNYNMDLINNYVSTLSFEWKKQIIMIACLLAIKAGNSKQDKTKKNTIWTLSILSSLR